MSERFRDLLERIVTGDGAQLENLDESFMAESLGEMTPNDDVEITIAKDTLLEAVRALREEALAMAEREIQVRFTRTELDHLVNVLRDAERDGSYYGSREQYLARAGRIKGRLMIALEQLTQVANTYRAMGVSDDDN